MFIHLYVIKNGRTEFKFLLGLRHYTRSLGIRTTILLKCRLIGGLPVITQCNLLILYRTKP